MLIKADKKGQIFACFYLKDLKMNLPVQTAMIIDDDPDLGRLLATFLEARKIHVLVTQTLAEAEKYLSYLKPTVIFLDNSFPEGLGINFIRNIKSADEEIKIIMMTGDTSAWIEEKAKDEGINYFLKKPFSQKIIDFVLDKLKMRKNSSAA
jgi:DNA-binding response OmpR family regulator